MNVNEHNTFLEELKERITKIVNAANALQSNFEESTDLVRLDELRKVLESLSDSELTEVIGLTRENLAENETRIKELEVELEGRKAASRGYRHTLQSYSSDKSYSEQLLSSVNARIKAVEFDNQVNALIKEAEDFNTALYSCIEDYIVKVNEDTFFSSNITEDAVYFVNEITKPIDNRFGVSDFKQDLTETEQTFNKIIQELCIAKVKGEKLSLSKINSRYDVINKFIDRRYKDIFK